MSETTQVELHSELIRQCFRTHLGGCEQVLSASYLLTPRLHYETHLINKQNLNLAKIRMNYINIDALILLWDSKERINESYDLLKAWIMFTLQLEKYYDQIHIIETINNSLQKKGWVSREITHSEFPRN